LDAPKGPHCAAAFETRHIPHKTIARVPTIAVLNIALRFIFLPPRFAHDLMRVH